MPEALVKIINSKSKTFLAFCFCFISGIAAFSFVSGGGLLFYLYMAIFVILFLVIIFWHHKCKRFLILCLLFFILGGLRFLITISSYDLSRIEYYNGNKVTLQGWVSVEPDMGLSDARYVVSVDSLKDNKKSKPVFGKVAVKNRLYPEYHYGDELEISCSLQEPENFGDSNFNYKKYLARQGIWSVCANPVINVVNSDRGNFFIKIMLGFKTKVANQMSKLWPEPTNSLMAGILYGSRGGLPKELTENFTRTGVTHIIAVSGYNVSIIVAVLNIFLIYIGLSRRQSFWFLISLIFAFVFFTGATSSVVRAGVMAAIVLFAQQAGRISSAGKVLLYAALIMVLINPYVLIWDAGFQLSFLSTLGLVYLSPILETAIFKKVKILPQLAPLVEILVTTISAIAVTLPLILFQFGRLSLVAPLVNVLILWVIPWLMLFGFLSLVLSWLFFPLGQALAWVAGLGLNYVIIIVDWFGNKSWSAVNIRLPLPVMILMYLALIVYVQKNQSTLIRKRL